VLAAHPMLGLGSDALDRRASEPADEVEVVRREVLDDADVADAIGERADALGRDEEDVAELALLLDAAAQLDERIASGQRIVGNPDECARAVQQYADIGCDQIIFGILASSQPQATALETVRLFGAEVQPRFDKDPVHSTTRYREAALQKAGGARAAV